MSPEFPFITQRDPFHSVSSRVGLLLYLLVAAGFWWFLYSPALSYGLVKFCIAARMTWKTLQFVTGSEYPLIVVLSGSMIPTFHRGDILFLSNRNYVSDPLRVGGVVVFKIPGRPVPIVHRIIQLIAEAENPTNFRFLTKGDNNRGDDRPLYAPGQMWLTQEHVAGKVRAVLPRVGMFFIYLNEYPKINYSLLLGIVLYSLAY